MKVEPEIIIVRETAIESIISDISSFALFLILISIGILIQSAAMQWVGALIGFACVFAKSASKAKRLSIDEARAYLDEIEASS